MKINKLFVLISSLLIIVFGITVIGFISINVDSGACNTGYTTFVFDKYSNKLANNFYESADLLDEISEIKPIKGTQKAKWNGITIYLEFDVEYKHNVYGVNTERLLFKGKRIWIDTFNWDNGNIIV
ncbi:MAG: hypothetical protein IKB88_03925 [Clostridia bacterium]|nr:hypothetical protein [Clostridia bacterium]MBR2868201.1 hypothetical protein [Clostridia bacterium]